MLFIKVKKIYSDVKLPEYKSEGASGLDLYAHESAEIRSCSYGDIGTGIVIELPEGYEGQIRARSGLAKNKGIGVLNAPGTIDSDYRGEIRVILFNLSAVPVIINKGDRIAQLVICSVQKVKLQEVNSLTKTKR